MALAVVTVATHESLGLRWFRASCRKHGIEPVVLGLGEPWGGFGWRLKLLLETLRAHLGEWQEVLFIDGFDSVVSADLAEIRGKFRQAGTRLLFAAEANCWPETPETSGYPETPFRYRFINGGGFLGEVEYLVDLMDELGFPGLGDDAIDQYHWARAFLSGKHDIRLDVCCEIFHCLFEARDDLCFESRIRNRSTRSLPCVFHGNGNTPYQDVASHVLGYRYRVERLRSFLARDPD